MAGDLFDLNEFLDPNSINKTDDGHCSAIVKVTDGNKDLLVSHNTMSTYQTMNRILKLYKFAYSKFFT